jgi:hypothetical protein
MASHKKTEHLFEAGDLALLMPRALPVLIMEEVKREDTFAKVHYDRQCMYVETFRLVSEEVRSENT